MQATLNNKMYYSRKIWMVELHLNETSYKSDTEQK